MSIRRVGLLVTGVLLAVLATLILTHSIGEATSGGSPYDIPEAVDTNSDPNILETTIVSDEASVDIGNGVTANAQTFNGAIPGPTLRLKVGDEVIVHYENKLEHDSGIHWHGIELANHMDGTPLTQNMVAPGGKFLYKFEVPRPGIYWYHPHHHSSTNQVFKGLYGMIIVTAPDDGALQAAGILPPASQTRAIVLSDVTVCKAAPTNSADTYDIVAPTDPWVGGGNLPNQLGPDPKSLCETPTAIDENGADKAVPYNANDIPAIQPDEHFGRVNEGQTVLTNGKNVGPRPGTTQGAPPASNITPGAVAADAAKLDVQAGQGLRLQLVNTTNTRFFRLRLTQSNGTKVDLVRVGGEGGLLSEAVVEGGTQGAFDTNYTVGEILLPPGSRADVVAPIPAASPVGSTMTLWTQDYNRTGGGFSNIPTVPVMHLNVTGVAASTYAIAAGTDLLLATGHPVETLGAATGALLAPNTFVPPKTGLAAGPQDIKLQAVANTELRVDGTRGEHDGAANYSNTLHMGSTRYAKEGDILELTVTNQTNADHPFHLHGFSIQPLDIVTGANTYTFLYKEFRDNVNVPKSSTLRFRVRLDARPQADGTTIGGALGRWVFHCHIFFHATDGMISEVVVVPGSGNERPDVNANGVEAVVNQGETATMLGSFADEDGDPVTLTSNVGTVTDTGGGNWSWSYPTGLDSSRFVYVTATDNKGLKSQVPFYLQVNNTAPSLNLPAAQSLVTGAPASFGMSATDPDPADPVALGASGLPLGLSFTDKGDRTGSVTGTVFAPPGDYPVTFSADDGAHPAVTGDVMVTVGPAPPGLPTVEAVVSDPEKLVKKAITVGCRLSEVSLQSCQASVFVGSKRVGRATKTLSGTGKRSTTVKVTLNKATRRRIARSPGGVPVNVGVSALKVGVTTAVTDTAKTTVVGPKVVVTKKKVFAAGSSKLSRKGKKALKKLGRTIGSAKSVKCVGRTRGRGAKACSAIAAGGLNTRFSSAGSRRVRSRNVKITILR